MTAPQMSRCDQGHKGGTAANHTMSGGPNTRSGLFSEHSILMHFNTNRHVNQLKLRKVKTYAQR